MISARMSIPPPGLGADDDAPCAVDADGVGAEGIRWCWDGKFVTCRECEGVDRCRGGSDDTALPLPESSQRAEDAVRFEAE